MAARANPLTDRVTTPAKPAKSALTMPARDLLALVAGLRQLGYDVEAVLAAAGFPDLDPDDADARWPCEAYGALIAHTQQARFTPNLALELARVTPLGAYPLLDYLVLTSDTVGAGLHQLAHYFRLVGSPMVITIREDVAPMRVELAGNAPPFSVEYTACLVILHLARETDGRFAGAIINFRHTPDEVVAFERAIGCQVRAMADWNGVSVPLEAWRLPLRRRDPVLREVLEVQANEALARLPARNGLAFDVQQALAKRVAGGDTRIGAIARELATSGRTLQRRLADEGVSYQELLDDARKETAARYLRASTLSISEVAYLVGYSEPAPFHRAFKRWYGVTPEGFRKAR